MITDGEKWHYLAVKSLPALLKGTTSNDNEGFYCLNCIRTVQKTDLKNMKEYAVTKITVMWKRLMKTTKY